MFKTKKASEPTEKDLPKEEKAPQAAPQREKPPAQHAIIPADLKITGDLVPPGPRLAERHPECAVGVVEGRPGSLLFEHSNLLP